MKFIYSLSWLDHLVMVSLHPEAMPLARVSEAALSASYDGLRQHQDTYPLELVSDILSMNHERKIQQAVRRFHTQFTILRKQALYNHSRINRALPVLENLGLEVLYCLENLMAVLETRFPGCICLEDTVSGVFYQNEVSEITEAISNIRPSVSALDKSLMEDVLISVIENRLNRHTAHSVLYGELTYLKALLKELGESTLPGISGTFRSLEVLLIYWNFNDPAFVAYLHAKLMAELSLLTNESYRRRRIKLFLRTVREIGTKPNTQFCLHQMSLKRQLSGATLMDRTRFMEKPGVPSPNAGTVLEPAPKAKAQAGNALVNHSVDQLGLFLRAADQTNFIRARSFKRLCEIVAPVVSTPGMTDVSPDSLRSNAYLYEEHDRLAVIQSLEKMIKWIRDS